MQRLVTFYVREYNEVMPHEAFDWRTPEEVYFGRVESSRGLRLDFSLGIKTAGSHVPHESLIHAHATFVPDAVWAVGKFLPDLSRVISPPRF